MSDKEKETPFAAPSVRRNFQAEKDDKALRRLAGRLRRLTRGAPKEMLHGRAHYRLEMKAICRGGRNGDKNLSARRHAQYVLREGPYARRLEEEQLIGKAVGNLPPWAHGDAAYFWKMADQHERANGTLYRELVLSLPRELTAEQQCELVRQFAEAQFGGRFVYTYGIHVKTATDGKPQAHCHMMFCERELDGFERDPEQFFARYNSKSPAKGGAKKAAQFNGKDRKQTLEIMRAQWAEMNNHFLRLAGHEVHVDHRSYRSQGLDLPTGRRIGTTALALERRGVVSDKSELQLQLDEQNRVYRLLAARMKAERKLIEAEKRLEWARVKALKNTLEREGLDAPAAKFEPPVTEAAPVMMRTVTAAYLVDQAKKQKISMGQQMDAAKRVIDETALLPEGKREVAALKQACNELSGGQWSKYQKARHALDKQTAALEKRLDERTKEIEGLTGMGSMGLTAKSRQLQREAAELGKAIAAQAEAKAKLAKQYDPMLKTLKANEGAITERAQAIIAADDEKRKVVATWQARHEALRKETRALNEFIEAAGRVAPAQQFKLDANREKEAMVNGSLKASCEGIYQRWLEKQGQESLAQEQETARKRAAKIAEMKSIGKGKGKGRGGSDLER